MTDGQTELLLLAEIFEPLPFIFAPVQVNAVSSNSVTEDSPIPTSIVPSSPISPFISTIPEMISFPSGEVGDICKTDADCFDDLFCDSGSCELRFLPGGYGPEVQDSDGDQDFFLDESILEQLREKTGVDFYFA